MTVQTIVNASEAPDRHALEAASRNGKESIMARNTEGDGSGDAFTALQQHWEKIQCTPDLLAEYELGRLVNRVCPKEKQTYGEGRIKEVAKKLGRPTKSFENRLWAARDLYVTFTKREIQQLCAAAKRAGKSSRYKLTVHHFYTFLSVKDTEQREQIQKQCIDRGWSVKRLRLELTKVRGKMSRGGAQLAALDSVDDALLQLLAETNDWLRRHRELWFGGGQPVLGKPLPKRKAADLTKQLQEAKAKLSELRSSTVLALRWVNEQLDRAAETKVGTRPGSATHRTKKPRRK